MGTERAVILGHTGFVGQAVLQRLQKHKMKVLGLSSADLDLTGEYSSSSFKKAFDPSATIIACSALKRQFGDSQETFDKNLKIAENIAKGIEEHGARTLVYLSSGAVYGEDIENTEITENTKPTPTSFYGKAKLASEQLLKKCIAKSSSALITLRPPLVYGPGEKAASYGPNGFVRAAVNGEKILLWGDGSEMREFLYIEDLAEIVARAATCNATPGTAKLLNAVSGTSYSFLNALDAVRSAMKKKIEVGSRPRSKEKVDHGYWNDELLRFMGPFIFTGLEEGVKKTFDAEMKR